MTQLMVKDAQAANVAEQASSYGVHRNWKAEIRLEFEHKSTKTVLDHMSFSGPLRVQRPFYPEGKTCHIYLLHPPGGMVSGDQLNISVLVNPKAHALLTTPSAGKVYGVDSHNVEQSQVVSIHVDEGVCEWLPQETILFNGAKARLSTRVELSANAGFIGWEIIGFGRQHGDEPFIEGSMHQSFELFRSGKPLSIEHTALDEQLELLRSDVGYMGYSYSGNIYLVAEGLGGVDAASGKAGDSKPEAILSTCRNIIAQGIEDETQLIAAVTHKPGIVIVRGFSHDAELLRNLFIDIWQAVRPELLGIAPIMPRIWLT